MNRKRYVVLLAVALALIMIVMPACSKPAPAPAPTTSAAKPAPAPTTAAAKPAAPAKTTTAAKPAAPAAFTALEQQLYDAAKKEGQVNWWDSADLKVAQMAIQKFTARYPGIKVEYFEAEPVTRFEKIMAEHQAGRTSTDVTSSSEAFGTMKKSGLIANMADILKDTNYPKELSTPDLDAATTELRVDGASYNTKMVAAQDVPKKWADLLDPKWKGKIAVDVRLKYFIGVYGAPGWSEQETVEYLKKLKAQNPIFQSGVSKSVTLQAAGEFPLYIGSMLHLIIPQQLKGAPIDMLPLVPMSSSLTPKFVLQKAPHPNAAKLFMRWMLTKEGLDVFNIERHTGSPLPDSGTTQGNWMKKNGVAAKDIIFTDLSQIPYDKIQKLYSTTIGVP